MAKKESYDSDSLLESIFLAIIAGLFLIPFFFPGIIFWLDDYFEPNIQRNVVTDFSCFENALRNIPEETDPVKKAMIEATPW